MGPVAGGHNLLAVEASNHVHSSRPIASTPLSECGEFAQALVPLCLWADSHDTSHAHQHIIVR
jgi:hypothetical protein